MTFRFQRILQSRTGPIGWFGHLPSDVVTLKRLLNLPVAQQDVERMVGKERSPEERAIGISSLLKHFQDEWIMFYCCPICGDPLCGGMAGRIRETEEHFTNLPLKRPLIETCYCRF